MTQNFSTMLRRASERVTAGLGALVLTAGLLVVSDAQAGTTQSVRLSATETVTFDQELLETSKGSEQVYRKLKSATRGVCGLNAGGFVTLEMRVKKQKCFDATLAEAVRKIDRPQLSALHQFATTRSVS